jgi:hypothetical protein
MSNTTALQEEIERLCSALREERAELTDIADLLRRRIEREAGIWEYGFEELEEEMWRRFTTLEEQQDCISEDQTLPSQRLPAAVLRRLKKWYRTISGPLSRTIMDKRKQFNLDQQSLLNKESIPFYLSIILSLQKIKDRLNTLEEMVFKLQSEEDEQWLEIQRMGPSKDRGTQE